jgi:iron complex outermembrane receptor protein
LTQPAALIALSRLSPIALALGVLLGGSLGSTSCLATTENGNVVARPSAPRVEYYLPAMPMAQAIETIARDFKVSLDITGVKLAGLRSLPVVGLHTADSAAAAALADSGLVVTSSADGSFKVQAKAAADLVVTIVGAKPDQAENGFKVDYSSTTARNGVSLQETPAGVTIIGSKVIETQQATSVLDVLTDVSSVVVQSGGSLSIRGFGDSAILSNGIASTADARSSVSTLPNVATVERIEVLKGPQSILAGAGILGGAVNIVMKKPQEDPLHTVALQREERDGMTLTSDLTGSVLSDDKRLTYRLIASNKTETTSALGFDGDKTSLVTPSLRWKDSKTDVTVSLTYQREHQATPTYTSSLNGVILPEPVSRPGNLSDGIEYATNKVTIDLEQKLPLNLTLISRLEQQTTRNQIHFYLPLVTIDATSQTMGFMGQNTDDHYASFSGDHYLRTKIDTGPIEQKIAVGFSHVTSSRHATAYVAEGFLPVTLTDPSATFTTFTPEVDTRDHSSNTQRGLYAQDVLRWNRTSLMIGVRASKYQQGNSYIEPAGGLQTFIPAIRYNANNSTVGLVHSITDTVSIYGVVAKGFQPQFNQNWCGTTEGSANETALRPMETTNKEVGAKFDLLNGKLALTTGYFNLRQSGKPVYVPNLACYDMQDGQRTKGLDVDIQGELVRGLNVIGSFTKTDIKDLVNPTQKFDGEPKQQGSIWMTYLLPWARVQGLSVGLGVSEHGKSTAGAAYSPLPTVVPAWTKTDASLFYARGAWTATLGVKNLSGKKIYSYSATPAYIPVLYDGRSVRFTLGYRFD